MHFLLKFWVGVEIPHLFAAGIHLHTEYKISIKFSNVVNQILKNPKFSFKN